MVASLACPAGLPRLAVVVAGPAEAGGRDQLDGRPASVLQALQAAAAAGLGGGGCEAAGGVVLYCEAGRTFAGYVSELSPSPMCQAFSAAASTVVVECANPGLAGGPGALPPGTPNQHVTPWCFVREPWCFVLEPWCFVHEPWCFVHEPWCFVHEPWCFVSSGVPI